jgi:hypothetical protein
MARSAVTNRVVEALDGGAVHRDLDRRWKGRNIADVEVYPEI